MSYMLHQLNCFWNLEMDVLILFSLFVRFLYPMQHVIVSSLLMFLDGDTVASGS